MYGIKVGTDSATLRQNEKQVAQALRDLTFVFAITGGGGFLKLGKLLTKNIWVNFSQTPFKHFITPPQILGYF